MLSTEDSHTHSSGIHRMILCRGSAEIIDSDCFALIWGQTDKKQEIMKQSCKDMIRTELPIIVCDRIR